MSTDLTMSTALTMPTLAGGASTPSKLSSVAARIVSVIAECSARRAARELRRHEAFIADLASRQDHSPLFLEQGGKLPLGI